MIETYGEGRRRATIRERAGKFAVVFLLYDDYDKDKTTVGGCLCNRLDIAQAKARTWIDFGEVSR